MSPITAEYRREWYAKNRERAAANALAYRIRHCDRIHELERRRKKRFIAWVRLLRVTQGCDACGKKTGKLVHHHTDPKKKKYVVSGMWHKRLEAFFDEVAKCEVLCWSCHKVRHSTMTKEDV